MTDAMRLGEMIEAQNQRESERKTIFDKARETGEKQILDRYVTDCDDPREECSTDIITIYAMPDGTTEDHRQHTW